jgi:FxsC-like protein
VWVVTLYNDLCKHIMQLTNLPFGAKPGFMDRELRAGNDWPRELAHALATCRVFVPLYSRRYFESEQCGKEWFAFSRRVLKQAAKDASRPEAIIPAIWVPIELSGLPEAALRIQFDHRELGDRYVTRGFYGIIKLSRYRDDYEEAVYELAQRIVDVAQRTPVEPGQPDDYEALESAFGNAAQRLAEGRAPGASGGRPLRVTMVAPTSDELPAGRGSYHYGRTTREWNPYRPDSIRPLADHASDLVRNLDYRPVVGDLDSHGDELTAEGSPEDPEVLLVDPWATTQAECQETLKRFDAQHKPWVQVVVPWNRNDTETVSAESQLRNSLDASLKHKLAEVRVTSKMAVRGVPCLDDFSQVLPVVIQAAIRQYLKHADVFPPTGPTVEKPRMLGPMTEGPVTEGPVTEKRADE